MNSVNSTEGDTAKVSRVSVCIGRPAVDCLSSAEVRKSTPSVECMQPIETDVVCNTIGDDEMSRISIRSVPDRR